MTYNNDQMTIAEYLELEEIKDESEKNFLYFLTNDLMDGLTKDIQIKLLYTYRIIVEYFIHSFWQKLPIDIQQNKTSFFKEEVTARNIGSVIKQINNSTENIVKIVNDKELNKEIKDILVKSKGFYINNGAHFMKSHTLISGTLRKDDSKFIFESSLILLKVALNPTSSKLDLSKEDINNIFENTHGKSGYVPQGGYINKSTLIIENFKKYGSSFLVPFYQRGYTWSEVEIETFLNSTENYKGSITSKNVSGIWNIIDGQQRIITILLAFEAIFPELNININNSVKYESKMNDLFRIKENKDKYLKIIKEMYDSKNEEKKNMMKRNIRESYFIIIDIDRPSMEIANFTYMNIASKEFEGYEKNRTKVIELMFEIEQKKLEKSKNNEKPQPKQQVTKKVEKFIIEFENTLWDSEDDNEFMSQYKIFWETFLFLFNLDDLRKQKNLEGEMKLHKKVFFTFGPINFWLRNEFDYLLSEKYGNENKRYVYNNYLFKRRGNFSNNEYLKKLLFFIAQNKIINEKDIWKLLLYYSLVERRSYSYKTWSFFESANTSNFTKCKESLFNFLEFEASKSKKIDPKIIKIFHHIISIVLNLSLSFLNSQNRVDINAFMSSHAENKLVNNLDKARMLFNENIYKLILILQTYFLLGNEKNGNYLLVIKFGDDIRDILSKKHKRREEIDLINDEKEWNSFLKNIKDSRKIIMNFFETEDLNKLFDDILNT